MRTGGAPPRTGAPAQAIRVPARPTTAQLQKLWPSASVAAGVRRGLLSVESGLAARGPALRNAADGLPGFRWDVPAPEAGRTVLWASLGFDWQFYEWSSLSMPNHSDHKVFVDGSLDWRWMLTGVPSLFPDAPVFLEGAGHFTFNTFIGPGGDSFDVGWLAPAVSGTFSSTPDKTDASMTSPLQRLLAMTSGGVLKLWFAMDFEHVRYRLDNGNDRTTGYVLDGGPTTIYYAYAYASALTTVRPRAHLLEG
jgi:hypothetical protein